MRVGDGLWVRLLDVGAALAARSYSAPGPIVFQVTDDFCTWNGGRWKLEGGVAKKTRADADLACDAAALGSVYLGGFTFAQLVRGGRVEELKRGAACARGRDVPHRHPALVPRSVLARRRARSARPPSRR